MAQRIYILDSQVYSGRQLDDFHERFDDSSQSSALYVGYTPQAFDALGSLVGGGFLKNNRGIGLRFKYICHHRDLNLPAEDSNVESILHRAHKDPSSLVVILAEQSLASALRRRLSSDSARRAAPELELVGAGR
jgi:hypothetical protein